MPAARTNASWEVLNIEIVLILSGSVQGLRVTTWYTRKDNRPDCDTPSARGGNACLHLLSPALGRGLVAACFVELHEPVERLAETRLRFRWDLRLLLLHAPVTLKEQRLCLLEPLLPRQGAAEEAAAVKEEGV